MNWNFEIIITYEKGSQDMVYVDVPQSCNTDEKFLNFVFSQLKREELENLVKFSTCILHIEKIEDVPDFILKRNGKYYFNYKEDEEHNILAKFLQSC